MCPESTLPLLSHTQRYDDRGVSSTKDEVHAAIKLLDKGLYPRAFCKLLPDISAGDEAFCNILHADTAGTKASLAYVYWRETGDLSVWKGIAQDAIVMNIDDMACVGCVDDFLLSNTITRNKHRIPGEVIAAIIEGTVEFCELMADHHVHIHNAGGETADVGDVVRTVDVGFTTFGRMPREQLILNEMEEGDVIIGIASDGQASYESAYNSGIGSNGLTSARHDIFGNQYAHKYPESYSPETPSDLVYSGSYSVDQVIDVPGNQTTMGKLVLSPTRTFVPVIRSLIEALPKKSIHGIIHCTGGGQTKVSKFLPKGLCAIKDQLPDPPLVFDLIAKASGASRKEMYQVFNMGVRLEAYTHAEHVDQVIQIANTFGIAAQVIGHVTRDASRAVVLRMSDGDEISY